jgi:cobalt-zinc-cadmium efflux system outer membrane protein
MKIQISTRWYRPVLSIALRPLALSSLLLVGCASAPPDRGSASITNTVARLYQLNSTETETASNSWQNPPNAEKLEQSLSASLTADSAVQIALRNNPKMRMLYADLGIAQAELLDATRIANPTFDWLRSKPTTGDIPAKLSFGLSQSVTDLLMLGARRKLGAGILQRTSSEITAQVSTLIFDVESAYWHAVGAEAVRAMRALVADSARTSSDLAERFFAAGNINRAQRAQENAAAAEALVALKNAEASALEARGNLNQILGLAATDARLKFDASLPTMAKKQDSLATLQTLAQTQRADLAASRQNVTLSRAMLGTTKRWRWFGELDISAERERESDGEKLRGIGFSLGLPIFNQGQGRVLHATAMLETATAQRDQMQLTVQSEVALGLEKLNKQREIVETYADVLVPAREAAVAEMQKRYNFMLIGAFELLQAKQAEYDAYQGYLDALRDYWLARTELKLAVGGELPSSAGVDSEPKIGMPSASKSTMGGTYMDHGGMKVQETPVAHDHNAMPSEPTKVAPAANKPVYVCPMHSDITSDKPSTCSICGMALELKNAMPTKVAPEANKPMYVCPMHSDITSDKPGTCSICGMALELKSGAVDAHQPQPEGEKLHEHN